MWNKRILLLAISGLLLSAVGCKGPVQSVMVSPEQGLEHNYARAGDTLEFVAYNPNTKPFYVIFDDPSPCAEKYVMVTATTPGRCKVVSGITAYSYRLSYHPPDKLLSIPTHCFPCDGIVVGNKNQLISTQVAPAQRMPDDATTDPTKSVGVSCVSNTVNINPTPVMRDPGEYVWWYPPNGLTITVPDPICDEGTSIDPYGRCTISKNASSGDHHYTIHMEGCTTDGTGTITIPKPPPTPK
jgi:hypothetical protein